ncbi:MAG: DinB family protein [Taibaiella sp.]|jgi:hypothetical protein
MTDRKTLVNELIFLLEKGNAHATFDDIVSDIPLKLLTETPENLPYNIWQLIEHIRITQWDILEFCRSAKHVSPKWPDEYWPSALEKVSKTQWEHTISEIKNDRKQFIDLLKDEANSLTEPIAHGDGQTLLREALLIADHNAYHFGEILVLRRLLNCWT